MPAGGKGAKGIKFPGNVPKTFLDRASALAFLHGSPKYVAKHANQLVLQYPKLFAAAGYRIHDSKIQQSAPTGNSRSGAKWTRWGNVGDVSKALDSNQEKELAAKVKTANSKPAPVDKPAGTPPSGQQQQQPPPTAPAADPSSLSPTVDTSGFDALNPNANQLISTKLADSGAKLFDPGAADAQAGLGYDAKIQSLRDSAAQNPLDTQQHQKDIGSWYKQVLGSLKTAGERDSAISKAAVGETQDNTKALISAIGGSANQGSGLVGAAGEQAAGTLGALGSAQDQYNQDLGPILQAEAAAQNTREGARGSSNLHDLQLQIAAALGQRGQAKAVDQMNIDQANNGILDSRSNRLISILGGNNQARQANFGNAFGITSTTAGLQATGAQLQNRQNLEIIKQTGKVTAAGLKKGPKPWASTPASQKTYAYKNLVGHLKSNAKTYQQDPTLLKSYIQGFLGHNGWSYSNPNVSSWVQNAFVDAGIQ